MRKIPTSPPGGYTAWMITGQKMTIVATKRKKYVSFLAPSFAVRSKCGLENVVMPIALRTINDDIVRIVITIIGIMADHSIHTVPLKEPRPTVNGSNTGIKTPIIVLMKRSISAKQKRILIVVSPEVYCNQP